MRRIALMAVSFLVCACGDSEGPDPCVETPTYQMDIASITTARCLECHSESRMGSARNGAPAQLNFDRLELFEDQLVSFSDAITSGRMPPQTSGAITTADERTTVNRWRQCGFPP